MSEPFALENNNRIATILNMVAVKDHRIDIAFKPQPPSRHKFTIYIKGTIDQFSGGQIRLIQQALFDELSCYSTITKAEQGNGFYQVTMIPDTLLREDLIDIRKKLRCITDENDHVHAINYSYQKSKTATRSYTCIPRRT